MPIELERCPLVRTVQERAEFMGACIRPEGVVEMYSAPPAREWYEPIEGED